MSSLERIKAVQGHPLPGRVGGMGDIFADIRGGAPGRIPGHMEDAPVGATCINGMQEIDLYTCDECGATVAEAEFEAHAC